MAIELQPEQTKQAIASLKRYVAENWDLDIGDLKARLFLEYLSAELGPAFYNAAVNDAQTWFRDRTADLEAVLAEPEFMYWQPKKPVK